MTWKCLTKTDASEPGDEANPAPARTTKIHVNMDAAAFMRSTKGGTEIVFAQREGGDIFSIIVDETPDEILGE